MGYRVHLLTNTGFPVGTVRSRSSALDLMFEAHRTTLLAGKMMCHYLDFICVAPGLAAYALFPPPPVTKAIWADIHQPSTAHDVTG